MFFEFFTLRFTKYCTEPFIDEYFHRAKSKSSTSVKDIINTHFHDANKDKSQFMIAAIHIS